MQTTRRGIAVVLAAVLVVCVLAVSIPADISGPPTHFREKRIGGELTGQFALSVWAVGNVQPSIGVPAAIETVPTAPNAPILQLICVRIC